MRLMNKLLLGVALFALAGSTAIKAEIFVDCDSGGDYDNIQEAVDAAAPYDTITVRPCVSLYDQDVFVDVEGLTIRSTEIAAMGPNTRVRAFSIWWAPSGGPPNVTIEGFTIGTNGCGSGNGVGIESSASYATLAHNAVMQCSYGIRVNAGNVGNNVHHNYVYNTGTGIEIAGEESNVHNNVVEDTGGEGCLYVWGDYNQVHQNLLADCSGNGGINAIGSTGNHIFRNSLCNTSIEGWDAYDSWVHNNTFYDGSVKVTNFWSSKGNRKKNNLESDESCPLD